MAGSFNDQIREATRNLSAFNSALRMASGSGGGGGGGGAAGMVAGMAGGKGFLAAAGPLGLAMAGASMAVDAAAAGAQFLTPAARGFAITGSSASLAVGITQSTISALGSNPFTNLLTQPLQVSNEVAQRAGQGVLGVTEDLARIGVRVSDKQRRALADISAEQENRVTEERQKVQDIVGSADFLQKVMPGGEGANPVNQQILSVLMSIENLISRGPIGGKN
jgi:hypothetical protein